MPVKDADRQLELRAQAARIKAYLPTLQERHVTLTLELCELETLLRAERAELVKLMDEADELSPKKRCPRCSKWKPPSAFPRNRANKDGLYGWCRKCKLDNERQRRAEAGPPVIPPEKFCSACRKPKPSEEFYRDRARPDGLQVYCRDCHAERQKARSTAA